MKKVIPKTSVNGFSLEYITYPHISDLSSNYITKEFLDLKDLFKDNIWSPIYFLDNESILLSARKSEEPNDKIFKYNLKTKELKELFQDPRRSKIPDLFYLNNTHFAICYDNMSILIDNDKVSKEILLEKLQEKYQVFDIPLIAVNPETEKVLILDYNKRICYLTDLKTGEMEELPSKGVNQVCWIDNNNLLLGTFDKFDNRGKFEGSAVVIYNIQSKASTKTYLGEREVFGVSSRNSERYCSFNFLVDHFGPPHGTIGVVDFAKEKIIFLELENVVNNLHLRNNWIVTAVANKPVDWRVWGRTAEDTVYLCVYDVATESYTIRAKNLSVPSMSLSSNSTIISPDGKTILYLAKDRVYINQGI
jgi:hypothetical protein